VNKLIRKKDAYSPISRVLLKTNNNEISISTAGRLQATNFENDVMNGDLLN
jgi:hypothetical protein